MMHDIKCDMHNLEQGTSAVGREIFIEKKFLAITSMTKIKPAKYFLRRINGVNLYCRVVIVTKIKPGENLIDEIF